MEAAVFRYLGCLLGESHVFNYKATRDTDSWYPPLIERTAVCTSKYNSIYHVLMNCLNFNYK
jgi:hypothetical protein